VDLKFQLGQEILAMVLYFHGGSSLLHQNQRINEGLEQHRMLPIEELQGRGTIPW
jgi:uncharacterized membrane protein